MDKFSTLDLANAVGVHRSVIADWISRGVITAPQSPGRGKTRVFTFKNAVEAGVAKRLNDAGIRSGSMKRVIEALNQPDENDVVRCGLGPSGEMDIIIDVRSIAKSVKVALSHA